MINVYLLYLLLFLYFQPTCIVIFEISYRLHFVESYIFNLLLNLWLLIGMLMSSTFNAIIDILGLNSGIFVFVFLNFSVFNFSVFFCGFFFFCCLPQGYFEYSLEFHFDLSMLYLSVFICIVFLVISVCIILCIDDLLVC